MVKRTSEERAAYKLRWARDNADRTNARRRAIYATDPGRKIKDAEYRQTNRLKLREYANSRNAERGGRSKDHRKGRYGLTPERFAAIWAEQDGLCANTGCASPLEKGCHVDHDHLCCPGLKSCGACVRGFLCPAMQPRLGHAERQPGPVSWPRSLPRRPPDEAEPADTAVLSSGRGPSRMTRRPLATNR